MARRFEELIRSNRMPEIFRVSNVDDDNNLMPPEHPTVQQVSLAQLHLPKLPILRATCSLVSSLKVSAMAFGRPLAQSRMADTPAPRRSQD